MDNLPHYSNNLRLTSDAEEIDERFAGMIAGYSDELASMKRERDNLDDLISDRENAIKMLAAMRELTNPHVNAAPTTQQQKTIRPPGK